MLGLALAAAAGLAAPTPRAVPKSVAAPKATPVPESSALGPLKAHSGPWGDIEWTTAYIEAPAEILDGLRKPDANPHWSFPGGTVASVTELFTRAGLPPEMQKRLFDPQRVLLQDGTLTLYPQAADLEALTAHAREIIYAELAKFAGNEYHHEPFIIMGPLEDWLRDTNLRPQIQDLIRKVSYHYGKSVAFSDLRLLFDYAVSDAEVEHIFKTFTRSRTLLGELKISPGSDAVQLLNYWTAGQPNSEVQPILQAALQRTGGATLDLMHLLPPLPRRRLYTFPTPDLVARGRYPDSHWTSFNFFTSSPQDPSLEVGPDDNHLLEKYDVAKPPYRMGDMLCLTNSKGETVHSCIYIADDVVFTKNGASSIKPWVLLPLQDVKDYFSQSATGEIKTFRRKWPAVSAALVHP